MRKEGTLNYYTQYIVNPDTPRQMIYSKLSLLDTPGNCDHELYRVCLDGHWGIIDNQGYYVAPLEYLGIGYEITHCNEINVIMVCCDDKKYNLLDLNFQKIFAKNYDSIITYGEKICYLKENNLYGLGDVSTGRVILEPCYGDIREISNRNNGLFQFANPGESITDKWGLLDAEGKVVQSPKFTNYLLRVEWGAYNLLKTDEILEGMYHYFVIDWDGKYLYDAWCIDGERYQKGYFGDKAENAFLFWTEGCHSKGGHANLVVMDYDEDAEKDCIYTYSLRISKDDWRDGYVGYKVIKKHKLQDKIFLNSRY